MTKHISITVRGKVQGVFFRASTKAQADEIGVTGFVKNLSDGCVYIEAEGSEEQLNELMRWCRQGPRMARVENCEVEDGAMIGFTAFQVLRS